MCKTDRGSDESRSEPIGNPAIGRREKDDLHLKVKEISDQLGKHIESEEVDRLKFFEILNKNTDQIQNLRNETREVIHAYGVMKATSEGLGFIQKGIVWLLSLGVVGAIINWLMHIGNK